MASTVSKPALIVCVLLLVSGCQCRFNSRETEQKVKDLEEKVMQQEKDLSCLQRELKETREAAIGLRAQRDRLDGNHLSATGTNNASSSCSDTLWGFRCCSVSHSPVRGFIYPDSTLEKTHPNVRRGRRPTQTTPDQEEEEEVTAWEICRPCQQRSRSV